MTATQVSVDRASQILARIKDHSFSGRQQYLHPYFLLSALLTHAPTPSGKMEIANDIINSDGPDLVAALTRLTDYFWTSLLVPRIHRIFSD